jgi:hypothetical protein
MYIIHSCPLSNKHDFYKKMHIFKSIIFMVKITFEPNVFKLKDKNKFHHFKSFCPSNHQCKHLLQFFKGLVHIW